MEWGPVSASRWPLWRLRATSDLFGQTYPNLWRLCYLIIHDSWYVDKKITYSLFCTNWLYHFSLETDGWSWSKKRHTRTLIPRGNWDRKLTEVSLMQLSVSLFGFIHETQNVNPWTVQDFCRGKFTMANFFFFFNPGNQWRDTLGEGYLFIVIQLAIKRQVCGTQNCGVLFCVNWSSSTVWSFW